MQVGLESDKGSPTEHMSSVGCPWCPQLPPLACFLGLSTSLPKDPWPLMMSLDGGNIHTSCYVCWWVDLCINLPSGLSWCSNSGMQCRGKGLPLEEAGGTGVQAPSTYQPRHHMPQHPHLSNGAKTALTSRVAERSKVWRHIWHANTQNSASHTDQGLCNSSSYCLMVNNLITVSKDQGAMAKLGMCVVHVRGPVQPGEGQRGQRNPTNIDVFYSKVLSTASSLKASGGRDSLEQQCWGGGSSFGTG